MSSDSRALAQRRRRPVRAVEPAPGRMALTVPEAAWELHSHPNHVWNLVAAGAITSFKLGRKRLIARSALEEFIANGGTGGADAVRRSRHWPHFLDRMDAPLGDAER